VRRNLGLWAWFARRPQAYRIATRLAVGALKLLGRRKGAFKSLPLAGGWTAGRDLPVPEGGTFMARYAQQQRKR
jgi:L-lactate dehydrogenase complex protein LldF